MDRIIGTLVSGRLCEISAAFLRVRFWRAVVVVLWGRSGAWWTVRKQASDWFTGIQVDSAAVADSHICTRYDFHIVHPWFHPLRHQHTALSIICDAKMQRLDGSAPAGFAELDIYLADATTAAPAHCL